MLSSPCTCTIALGMGVDVKDVCYGAPRSIDDYFQESGRGGRSGGQCTSTIYWKPSEAPMYKDITEQSRRDAVVVRKYLDNTTVCRRKWLLDYFQQQPSTQVNSDLCCDICAQSASDN